MRIEGDGASLRQLRTLLDAGRLGELTDGQLLERFATRPAEVAGAAFEALVGRHGPMVLRVCRGLLDDANDVQDAFQATFLVLLRKAHSLWVRDSLGPWLYQVAYRTACSARADAARRRRHERRAAEEGAAARAGGQGRLAEEAGVVIHEEIARLPKRYREVVVLCDLQGYTNDQAARNLGCPAGTVKSRLARGRARLRERLARRGVGPFAVAVAVTTEPVPASVRKTAQGFIDNSSPAGAAAGLARGVLRAMFWDRMRVNVMAAALVGVVGTGAGVLLGGEPQAEPVPATDHRQGETLSGQASKGGRDDPGSLTALRRRVDELERKLESLLKSREGLVAGTAGDRADSESIFRVRPRFECLVERVAVRPGAGVKRGTLLAELFSVELAAAKNDYLAKSVRATHAQRLFDLREGLVNSHAISQQLWVDTQNERENSRLDLTVAHDRLSVLFGLSDGEIDGIKDEAAAQKARCMLRAPVDGTVVRVDARVQDLADRKSVLFEIEPSKP